MYLCCGSVSLTDKIFNGWIRDLRFNPRLYKKPSYNQEWTPYVETLKKNWQIYVIIIIIIYLLFFFGVDEVQLIFSFLGWIDTVDT